jgi:hypothetical protein
MQQPSFSCTPCGHKESMAIFSSDVYDTPYIFLILNYSIDIWLGLSP